MFYRIASLALCTSMLLGCAGAKQAAQNAAMNAAGTQEQQGKAIVAKVTAELDQATTKVIEQTGNKTVASDPTLIPFEKMNSKLTPVTEQQVRALAPALVIAKQIVVTGFCDRREVGNAEAAAKARAMVVKNLLVESGISAIRITVRSDTKQKLHAVRITFNG
ncbi:OmpA family protein [Pseudogulbenkiania sp. MAI-1]|uniref:OmpA family protein n=1 Tax=Pseudogulbenkiania sp. MAI-1 TaxID=990370 RepID=UPI00045EB431|nr:OmpA family protein [Pseudogulbenkiania sp. MAI-1]